MLRRREVIAFYNSQVKDMKSTGDEFDSDA
jgi:hypothetical protein